MRLSLLTIVLISSISFAQVNVTIRVIVPESTPKDAELFIAGDKPELGNWDPGLVKLNRVNESTWERSFSSPLGVRAEFKITRGSWNTQAVYEKGALPPNTVVEVQGDTVVELRPIAWSDEGIEPTGKIVGTVQYHRGLKGKGLQYDRDVIVWLPPSYEKETARRYPVLYMHDGQNVFDPGTSFIGYDWRVDDVADSLMRAGKMREIIIAGIYNSPDRTLEYSNTEKGRAYGAFLVNTLKPLIDSTYRTMPDRSNTAVMGSSMGAHISFLLSWWHPDVFSQAGCLSAAFWTPNVEADGKYRSYNDETLDEARSYTGTKKDIRIYLDNGTEGLEAELQPGVDTMKAELEKMGYAIGKDFEYFIDAKAEHNERAWAARVWRPLMFMFGKD
ncbi:MAG: histidine kinase [Ignavibacteriae bacterium]|nr:histidine kinase [Ignavibacteriota bacterium]